MTVPLFKLEWLSSRYGTTEDVPNNLRVTRKRFYDGAVVGSDADSSSPKWTHVRGGYSVNRRRPILGTSTYWIPPSSYSRSQFLLEYKGSGLYRGSNLAQYWDGPLRLTQLNTGYTKTRREHADWMAGPGPTKPATSTSTLKAAIAMAEYKAMEDLASAKAQLGEALATSRRTADLFVDTSTALLKFINGVRRFDVDKLHDSVGSITPAQLRRLAKSGKYPRNLANKWLAYHYGWRPLAQDVYGVWEILRDQLAKEPALLVHGRGSAFVEATNVALSNADLGTPQLRIESEGAFQVRANITARVLDSGLIRAATQAGLTNPAALIWELIPFSFVVDWFVPVGGLLNALAAPSGTTFQGGHRSMRWSELYKGTPVGYSAISKDQPTTQYWKHGHDRERYTWFPRPAPVLKPFYTGGDRWATIAALLTGFNAKWGR